MEFHDDGSVVTHNDPSSGIAGCTLPLEYQRLSDLTGDSTYGDLNKKTVSYFLNPQPASNSPFPGIIGQNFDPSTGQSQDADGGFTGGSDSFYEYLVKAYLYDEDSYGDYMDFWKNTANSAQTILASHPSSRTDLTWLASWKNTTLSYYSEHCEFFVLIKSRAKLLY